MKKNDQGLETSGTSLSKSIYIKNKSQKQGKKGAERICEELMMKMTHI